MLYNVIILQTSFSKSYYLKNLNFWYEIIGILFVDDAGIKFHDPSNIQNHMEANKGKIL